MNNKTSVVLVRVISSERLYNCMPENDDPSEYERRLIVEPIGADAPPVRQVRYGFQCYDWSGQDHKTLPGGLDFELISKTVAGDELEIEYDVIDWKTTSVRDIIIAIERPDPMRKGDTCPQGFERGYPVRFTNKTQNWEIFCTNIDDLVPEPRWKSMYH